MTAKNRVYYLLAVKYVCVFEFQEDRKNGLFPFFVSSFLFDKYSLMPIHLRKISLSLIGKMSKNILVLYLILNLP